MNLKLDSNVKKVNFNGNEVDKVKFNNILVWSKPTPVQQNIYGVEWPDTTGADTQVLIRTDDSANFADPDPYVADGNHPGSSPFDNCMPWSGIVKETIDDEVYVKIPKFWFKYTFSGHLTKLQIANYPAEGFTVSPAHMDKGYGEQDYAYIGRYLSGTINGTDRPSVHSRAGYVPYTASRSNARIWTTGDDVGLFLFDYSALISIWMLYLVEFAHTDSQSKIGYGCRSGSAAYNTGVTDSMPYHTGTVGTSRTTFVNGVQYRYIEDLWGNQNCWVDGVRFTYENSQSFMYIQDKFSDYNDTRNGYGCGNTPSPSGGGYVRYITQPRAGDIPWAIRLDAAANATYYNQIPDYQDMRWSSSGAGKTALSMGGAINKATSAGLFYLMNANPSNMLQAYRIQYVAQRT